MSVTKYQIYLKTVEMGSFTAAARALNFTQSGVSHEKDRNLNNGEYDSTPLDLDGDGTPDINSSATRSSVISSFQRYAELLTQEDDLTIFITSHGGQINSETYTFALWNDIAGMTSDELANLLNNINARCINIILTTCRSGGFYYKQF